MIAVVFRPAGTKAFFRTPADELFDQEIAFADIEDKSLCELADKLTDTADNSKCVNLIERFLFGRLHLFEHYNFGRINSVMQAIDKQQNINISQLAQISCLSNKQFNRIFSEYVGANPKEFLRIVRFQRALYTLQTHPGMSLTELAFDCGFYDQPHLIKEFRKFSGYTPREYLSVCAPYSDYFTEP